jgi:transposase
LPLYRQQSQFARIDVDLSRSTMADWMLATAAACQPVMEAMQRKLRSGPVLQVDETSVQVMGEEGRADTTRSYMWVARGGPPGEPVLIYHYAPSRGAPVAAEVIGDYQGFVQTDGYEAYDRVCLREGIVHVGCWAHARRGFTDAKKAGKESKKAGAADQALALIAKLYAAESRRDDYADTDQFNQARRAEVEPTLENLRAWLERKSDQVLPQSALGQAVRYTLEQWPKLIRYLDSPELTPDTNAVERAIRPFVLGRKNWLFSGSPRGATASATLYSLIETAKANRLEPYRYLRQLFEKLPLAKTHDDYANLVPRRLGR